MAWRSDCSRAKARRCSFVAGWLLLAAPLVAVSQAEAQSASPYDTIYSVSRNTPMYAGMSTESRVVGTIPGGSGGIVMRWCRPEMPFGEWQFGNRRAKRRLLDERWCEVGYQGKVGNVQGRALKAGR